MKFVSLFLSFMALLLLSCTKDEADNGIGMDEDQLNNLLINQTVKPTASLQGEKGNGLGLLLSKELVGMNGSTMEVKSSFGKGTKVTIFLPLATVSRKL